jgi:hypothetical protein
MGIREKLQLWHPKEIRFSVPLFEKEGLGEILSISSKAS